MDVKFENNGGPETLLTHQRRQNFFVFDFREIWIWYVFNSRKINTLYFAENFLNVFFS